MNITIYLPDETGKWAKEHDLPLSRMLRDAVDAERKRRETLARTVAEATTYELAAREPDEHGGFSNFTARLHGTLIGRQSLGIHGPWTSTRARTGTLRPRPRRPVAPRREPPRT